MSLSRLKRIPLQANNGSFLTIVSSLGGGWTIENMTKTRFIKPGVVEIWVKKK